jgi:hypothetical protein
VPVVSVGEADGEGSSVSAPDFEAGSHVTTTVHYAPPRATGTTYLQVLQTTIARYGQLRPPTYMPPTGHPYKCPGGQL